MGLAFVFKLSLYLLTGFVGLALGLAEQGPIPFLSVPITVFAYWWCETGIATKKPAERSMDETIAVILGVIALIAAVIEFFAGSAEGKLLAGIHLVVYLTWIVLLQQKSVYRCWLLLALGIMHVAVGSVLTNATWYGLAMVVYLFGAIWTLSLFSMYRAAVEFAMVDPTAAGHRPATASSSAKRSQVYSSVRFDNSSNWISMRLVSGVIFTSLGGLVVGAAFFILIPRVSVGPALGISDEALPSSLRSSVLATEIKLGDMGPTLNSNDPALTMRLYNNQTNEPINPQAYAEWLGLAEPLFRTASLTEYQEGRWRSDRAWSAVIRPMPASPDDTSITPAVSAVRQEIRLERIGTDVLPCMGRPVAMRDPEGYRCGRMQHLNTLVERRDWFKRLPGAVDYVAYSVLPDPEERKDVGLVANLNENVMYRLSKYKERCSIFPDKLERLRTLTHELVDAHRQKLGRKLTDVETAQLLESHLRDSGEFTYSLELEVVDSAIDPVEDFVFNRRTGHCQYFASALALMCRAAGIPARLIMGFKGGERQADGELKIEKRFAHAWVEVWIDNRKWMTFDATPEAARAESITEIGTKRSLWTAIVSRVTGLWESNILDISYERQEDYIYEPLRKWLAGAGAAAREVAQSPWTSLTTSVVFMIDPRNWLTVPGAITLAFLGGLLWLIRRKTGWLNFLRLRQQTKQSDVQGRRIEFYERFARLMQTHGRRRADTQTQAEFVQELAGDFAGKLSDPSLEAGFDSIGDLFYLVRFGDGDLSIQESVRVDELLTRLENELNSMRAKRQQSA